MGSPIQSQLSLSVSSGDMGMVFPTPDFNTCRVSGREGEYFGRLGVLSPRQQRLATPAISFRSYSREQKKVNEP